MGKKQRKPGKGKEKTERKTAKAEEKKARRETKKVSIEDDIDAILASIQKEESKKTEIHVEENVPAPSPRSNCSLNINPLKESELILYGGEYYNGNKTFVYGDLYRYNVEKLEWKLVSSPNSPPPRSAHQSVAWKDHLYVFGGEFTSPNQERFHHYKDFWMLNLKSNQWEQLLLKGAPTARSGHRMVLYKHTLIVFGGFYDTLREVRYFNDLHAFDLDMFKWQEIKPKPGSLWPSPRSGFQFFVFQDEIFLYGGYSKVLSADKSVSEKGVVHADLWSLDPRSWEWNKIKKIGLPPGPRAGFSMCVHKRRALLFGGVVDMEVEDDTLMSVFLNELYGFQMDNHRWYPLELRNDKAKDKIKRGGRFKQSPDNFACGDHERTSIIKESNGHTVCRIEEHAQDVAGLLSSAILDEESSCFSLCETSDENLNMILNGETPNITESPKPCGRINACMAVGRDTLYVYGGMMEIRDREVTLNDLYALDLNKLDEWRCIIQASESEWLDMSEDEDAEDTTDSEESERSDSDESQGSEQMENHISSGVEAAVAILTGSSVNLRRKERRSRIDQIRANLGLSESQRTPMPGESLRDFYRRTCLYWQMAAHEHTQHTGKELRKDGFDLAEVRYKELQPILVELAKLEIEQKAEEEAAASLSKKGKAKCKKQGSQK